MAKIFDRYLKQVVAEDLENNKLYMWDWSLISDPGPRFENFIASLLLTILSFSGRYTGL